MTILRVLTMKTFMKKALIIGFAIICVLSCPQITWAQDTLSGRLAILPFQPIGINPDYVRTAESLLRIEIGKLTGMDIISEKAMNDSLGAERCVEAECARKIGKILNAKVVVGGRLSALGEKVIVEYFLVNIVSGKEILHDHVTSSTIEDIETVMKRVAKSIVEQESFTKKVEVGSIMKSESAIPERRASRKNFGFAFGYLYPVDGYDNDHSKSLVIDARVGYELEDYTVGMLAGIRKGFAMNLFGSYLLSKQDFCPYIGGSFGFHWVSHNSVGQVVYNETTHQYSSDADKRGDGFEIGAHAGIRAFRTFNFQVILNLEYIYTLNDFNDGALVFTIGLL